MKTSLPVARSMFWNNIPRSLLEDQARVFEHLGIPLVQEPADKVAHGCWMDAQIAAADDDGRAERAHAGDGREAVRRVEEVRDVHWRAAER
mgnify:CR=1 FL=1